ncbi:MAG TPA: acetylxylan esterase [Motilibacteraceae bacterium]|nr:acetylxylan esterase [Motilibacteraceae bacterium]
MTRLTHQPAYIGRDLPRGDHTPPADLDEFWATSLPAGKVVPQLEKVGTRLKTVDVFDVVFPGFGQEPVRAWLVHPAGTDERLPVVVEYMGYGGGRALAHERLLWASAGYAHLAVDTRGQGSTWSVGHTPDPHGSDPAHPGYLTKGIGSRDTYYYRRVFTDAACAVHAARELPGVDPDRIVLRGASQGGGITIAAAALAPEGVVGALVDVPFLCDIGRAAALAEEPPYTELRTYLATHRDRVAQTLDVLRYFDGVVLSQRATVPSLWSVGLMDVVCPPETVFAAYDAWAGQKSIEVYPYCGHDGGGAHHSALQLEAAAAMTS